MHLRILATTILSLLAAGLAQAQPTIETIKAELQAAWDKNKSVSADVKILTEMENGPMKIKAETTGTYLYQHDADKRRFRIDLKNSGVQSMGGQENKLEQTALIVGDGESVQTLTEANGQKSAFKAKPKDSQTNWGGKAMLETMKDTHEFKLLPDEQLDGTATYVIEVAPKTPSAAGVVKQVFYFDKAKGSTLKSVGMDKDGKAVQQMTLSNIKYDADVPADKFTFTLPEGVTLTDMTASAPPAPRPAPTTQAAEPKTP